MRFSRPYRLIRPLSKKTKNDERGEGILFAHESLSRICRFTFSASLLIVLVEPFLISLVHIVRESINDSPLRCANEGKGSFPRLEGYR